MSVIRASLGRITVWCLCVCGYSGTAKQVPLVTSLAGVRPNTSLLAVYRLLFLSLCLCVSLCLSVFSRSLSLFVPLFFLWP